MRSRGISSAAGVALALFAVFAEAPGASAAVSIGPERIVVTGKGASAAIERDPFRVSFRNRDSRPVLSQVPNAAPGPFLVAPLPDPSPLGLDTVDGPTLYAPLTFTVGSALSLEYPATPWVGNRLTGVQTGLTFSPRAVTAATRAGAGVELTIATNDPAGRRLAVRIAPGRGGTMTLSARVTPDAGVVSVSDSFATAPGEAFRGFGGRHNALDQRGNDFYNWVEQQNTGAGPLAPGTDPLPGTGGDTYLFPNGPAAAYYVQSQFVSSRGYGFLLDRNELSGWRMASDRENAWQVTAASSRLDYLVAPGSVRVTPGALTRISGRHRPPPRWALGPQYDRLTRFTGETPATYRASVEEDLANIERYDLPVSAYRIEAWAWLERDYLRALIQRLHRMGIRALLYFRPFVGLDDIGTDDPALYEKAIDEGWVATSATGQPYIYVGNFNNLTAQIDFTDPGARRWWSRRIRSALRLGADGFMQDFGEQVQNPMRFDNGETGATMHNRYPVLFHRTTRLAVRRFERRHPGRRIWFFTRSGFSGTPGSAAFEGGNFPGDETTDWTRSSGLASLTTDMLNRAIGGAFGYGSDIGGYFDFHTPATTKELFLRWAQWSALSPIFRLHGSINAGTHAPWTYDDQTVRIYKRYSRLHIRAVPLISRLWKRAKSTGIPPTRPLWLQFPRDDAAAEQDQEWMLGSRVLVAPVVTEGARSRSVYFPRGCWRAPGGRRYRGPASIEVAAPLQRLPYFVRCGRSPLKQPRR